MLPKRECRVKKLDATTPLFKIGDPVIVTIEEKYDIGIVVDIRKMFDWRNNEMAWGYYVDLFGTEEPDFNPFIRIPERYLSDFFKGKPIETEKGE
jgi:hypothetical protein